MIGNKWVGFGLNALFDGLVCTPLDIGTADVGGVPCGLAVGAGITALSCQHSAATVESTHNLGGLP